MPATRPKWRASPQRPKIQRSMSLPDLTDGSSIFHLLNASQFAHALTLPRRVSRDRESFKLGGAAFEVRCCTDHLGRIAGHRCSPRVIAQLRCEPSQLVETTQEDELHRMKTTSRQNSSVFRQFVSVPTWHMGAFSELSSSLDSVMNLSISSPQAGGDATLTFRLRRHGQLLEARSTRRRHARSSRPRN
jgi:hypothetical protein